MNIVLLGAPGSGKGSQAELLSADFGLIQISTGDLIRTAISAKTDQGVLANEFVIKGSLVPDDLVFSILKLRLAQPDAEKGVIFDGYPRSVAQAEVLYEYLRSTGKKIDMVFYITSTPEIVVERLLSRRLCSVCGTGYNMVSNPPVDNKCTECGGEVISRSDDNEEVIKNRLDIYFKTTKPLVEYYSETGLLSEIDGDRKIIDVYSDLKKIVNEKTNKK
ncbi:MAG: adenylate kinase [Candidatus Delongbacteria bacterium]|nr:adenylate kinase [Candidatus Delongbacteria bacterium]